MAIMKGETLASVAVAAVVVAIGAVPIVAGVSLIHERIAHSSSTSASADVVSAERLWLRELVTPFKRERWEVTYEFRTAKGAVVRSSGSYSQSRATTKPEPGRKLRVVYRPDDPTSGYLEDPHRLFDVAWYIGLGLFIWLAAGVFVWVGNQARAKKAS
jgi:hypothetical protein